MILSSPWWCLLAVLALLPWVGPWRGNDRVQNTLRSLLFLMLALALTQPRFRSSDSQVDRVLILDRSASVVEQAHQSITSLAGEFADSGRTHLVAIGQPVQEDEFSGFGSVTWISDSPSQGSSPLSAALSHAASLITHGSGGSVTVASDAMATREDDSRAISALLKREIPIHWVELPSVERPPMPVQVYWTEPLRKGSTSRLNVRVVSSGKNLAGEVSLQQDGETLASATCSGDTDQVVVLDFEPSASGFLEADVIVSSAGGQDSEQIPVVLPIHDAPQLLYLGSLQTGAAEKFAQMIGSTFDVQSVDRSDADAVRQSLGKSDLVMLDDIPAELIPADTEQQIVNAVQTNGLGLVMSGGRASFGAGGWHNRPIETMLPVEFVQKEEKRDPSTSLVVVIDTSGSMSGVRVQLAKEVARLAMRRLLPHDKVGIVEFYGAKRWAAPLQPASNAIELQRALNRMDAGGGTVILPALEEAFYGLQNVDTRYKHVLVLTDGGVESGDFESLMRRMAGEGINVSTVLAGGGYHSEFLVNIANWGKGRFYNVPNRFNLPEILLKQPSTTKLPAYRPGIHTVRVRGGAGWWGDVDTSNVPSLAGYVESKPRPGSQVLLETATEKHPILSSWRYGLGRVTTLTTEPVGAGTEPWQQWPEYSQALARILQRSAADARDPFRYEVEHDGGEVIVHAIRQQSRAAGDSRPVARMVAETQSGVQRESSEPMESLNFLARSPDRFIARIPAPHLGETLRFETSASSTPLRWQPLVVGSGVVPENRVDPHAQRKLARLVAVAGGKRFGVSDDWVAAPASTPSGKTIFSIGSWLFGFALMLFLAEIIWRRMPVRSGSVGSNSSLGGSAEVGMPTKVGGAAIRTSAILAFAFCVASGNSVHAQTKIAEELSAQVNESIDLWLENGVDREEANQVFRLAVLSDGSIQPLLDWLFEARGDLNERRGQVIAELEVHLSSRRGDLGRASRLLGKLLDVKGVADQRPDLMLWQAKLKDALGEVDEAKVIYESLLQKTLPEADQRSVRLRLALMGLIANTTSRSRGSTPQSNDAKPLIELAGNSPDTAFRNRAAIVLAVQNKYADAIKLFTVEGAGTERFRNASRVTEWAIRAQQRDQAIKTAWDAVDSAELKRDRNYALSLLVESYRLQKEKAGLEELVQKLKSRSESEDTLPAEAITVWINLLRELGKYDEAIDLFKATAQNAQGFTVEMRRELLEMEGEAGYEDRMIDSYRQLIQSEPNELTWRRGLTQILLEKGQADQAEALWTDYVGATESRSQLLVAAKTLGEFGMDELAEQTIERMVELRANHGQALLYWADLQKRRGEVTGAEATLNRIQAMDDVGDEVRAELAGAYERVGRQDKAIEVNEAIRASRGTVAEDLEMRLAWLYSEVGDEDRALDQWVELWRKTTSVPRRRYVEDRLMTVASRLGTLADIAIELEEKLADGTADDREAGLLIRIYSRVNDSVAATEISEEYMAKSGKNEVERLQEQGRIYQICNDYWNYEKVIERLIAVDPEGETEYLRQLALSMLERGKAQEARAVLMTLRDADDGKDSIGGEFEAGVLSLVGLKADAAKAYRKGIATHPDRIESYLLLANILKEMDQTERAVGMFQYLAENAEKDDLFTIAIDGLLNMEAKGPAMQWARRITLERLAGREDKNYLYQLLSDLSSEVNDKSGQIRAMENSLAVSGTRRLSVLRECMELSSKIRGGVYYSSSSRGPSNRGNQPFFAFGRRLIGLGELMPPQVFLDLGQAFLDDGDTQSAERTFGMARNLADPRSYQREVATIFEKAGKIPEALIRYDKLLRTSPSDVALIARVAKLNEQAGEDDVAYRFYRRGLDLLLSQTPLTTQDTTANAGNRYWATNRDAYDTYSDRLLQGLLVSVPDDQVDELLSDQVERLHGSLQELDEVATEGRVAKKLADSPRILKRSKALRRIYFAFERINELEEMDRLLINRFSEDQGLSLGFARERIAQGRYDSVQRMLASEALSEDQRLQLESAMGDQADNSPTAKLSPREMWRQFLPVWMAGDREAALRVLRRVDQKQGRAPGARPTYVIVNGVAVMQSVGSASDVAVWMRLATSLGDDGLALQFARSRLASGSRYGVMQIKQLFDTYREILPEESFADLVRYAANLYKDQKQRLADYLWIVSKLPQYVGDEVPNDKELLKLIEDSDLQINYYFPFELAMDAFPESIRADAMADTLERIIPQSRPRELAQIPFRSEQPIDDALADVLLDSIKSGISPALQNNYLRYCVYTLPRTGTAIREPKNAELAIKVLDLLMVDDVRKREAVVSQVAEFIKAVVLHQSGQTDQALEIVLKSYNPEENVTDPYVRYARDWAYRELVPVATEQFLARIGGDSDQDKLTVEEIDKRFVLLRQAGDEKRLRQEYQNAIKQYPDEAKYLSAYERWEQSQKRPFAVIDVIEGRVQKASGGEDDSQALALKKRLGSLLLSVNHLPKALPYWKIADDQDIESFDAEKGQRSQKKPEPEVKAPSGDPKITKVESKSKQPTKTTSKKYAATMTGLKAALDDDDQSAAQETLRKIWRSFPPAVASPYGYRGSNKRLNGLAWPNVKASQVEKKPATKTKDKTEAKPVDAAVEDRALAESKARASARGGLALFTPPAPRPRTPSKSAWEVLADYPFAVAEMRRIMRSRPGPPISNVKDVSLGLLRADRNRRGDDAAFASLVEKVHEGHVSDEVLVHLFAMLDENYGRVNQENESLIDDLLERLDLTNAQRASQLAELCAQVGQVDRAKALYRHCALLTTTRAVSLQMLITQAERTFEGDEMMELAESMFRLTNQTNVEAAVMLQLRSKLLDPPDAAERSRQLVDGDPTSDDAGEMQKAIQAVPVFSRVGDMERATRCLMWLLGKHGEPRTNQANPYAYQSSSSRNQLRVSRSDLIEMFPAEPEDYADYAGWLSEAADATNQCAVDSKSEIIVETLLTIALRQCQRENVDAARKTLAFITDKMLSEAEQYELLAIDVMRLAGVDDRALQLERMMYEEQRLSHVRFGDLLRDTVAVEGQEAGAKVLDELVERSMDQDLIAAAEKIAEGSDALVQRSKQLRSQFNAAKVEYESRIEAAKQRMETRRQWRVEEQSSKAADESRAASATRPAKIQTIVIPATKLIAPLRKP